jgi:hypothetical protein
LQEEEDKIKEALFLSSSPSPTKQEPPAPCLSPPLPTLDNSRQEEQGVEPVEEPIQSLDESDVMEVEDRVPEEEKEDITEEELLVAAPAPVTTSMQEVEVNAEQEISASENSSSSDQSQAVLRATEEEEVIADAAASEQPADSGDLAVTKATPEEEGKISMQVLPAVDGEKSLSEKESSSAKEDGVENNSLDGLLGLSEAALASLGREELISALRSLANEQLRLGKEQQRLALRQGQIGDIMVIICSAMDQL